MGTNHGSRVGAYAIVAPFISWPVAGNGSMSTTSSSLLRFEQYDCSMKLGIQESSREEDRPLVQDERDLCISYKTPFRKLDAMYNLLAG